MRHAGVDDDGIARPVRRVCEAVGRYGGRLGPGRKVVAGAGSKGGIDLDRSDLSGAADDLGKDSAIVTGAGADMTTWAPSRNWSWSYMRAQRLGCPLLSRRSSSIAISTSW